MERLQAEHQRERERAITFIEECRETSDAPEGGKDQARATSASSGAGELVGKERQQRPGVRPESSRGASENLPSPEAER